jgi:peptidoglycan lytic transglycosylase
MFAFHRFALKRVLGLTAVCISLAACAETQIVTNTAKEVRQATAPAAPEAHPVFKVGKPYQVDGVWYYPAMDDHYSETGIASWYGPDFHGKYTANGELFDMNEITAAHKTLPLPSMVRVTNLENGRSLLVRVNDRGPFVNGRVIDLSRRAAQLLGFEAQGTAKVKVEIDADQSRQLAFSMPHDPNEKPPEPSVSAAPVVPVQEQALPPPPGATAEAAPARIPAVKPPVAPLPAPPKAVAAIAANPIAPPPPVVSQVAPGPSNMYIQAGAFSQYDNANRLKAQLSPIAQARITQINLGQQPMFRVRIGPIADLPSADRMLDQVIKAGYKDAQLIVAE